jgi:hypothetical protein
MTRQRMLRAVGVASLGRKWHTFRSAAQQYVDATENMFRLGHSGTALAHDASIAAYAPYAILPALPILPVTLALVHKLAKLGTAVLVLDLVRR